MKRWFRRAAWHLIELASAEVAAAGLSVDVDTSSAPELIEFELVGPARDRCAEILAASVVLQPWIRENGRTLADALRAAYPQASDAALACNVLIWLDYLDGSHISASFDPDLAVAVVQGAQTAAIAELVAVELGPL